MTDDVVERARAWIALDPDPSTRLELAQLADAVEAGAADVADLAAVVDGRLSFGTAGLRGPLGAGPRRMNVLVATQTAAGIARVLLREVPDAARRGVVVGRDARHGSDAMAISMAECFRAHGLDVAAFTAPVPTPLVATTLLDIRAAAAVVVTASHNPATDNGIKVYWGDGAQIVAPLDALIAAEIDDVADRMLRAVVADPDGGRTAAVALLRNAGPAGASTPLGTSASGTAADRYVARAIEGRGEPDRPTVPLAITSLHGVGADLLERVLVAAGHDDLHVVVEQRDPDPDFPTAAFPNPEEPGALDLLRARAADDGCVAGLANDPDADRLAVVVPDRDGSWRQLTGDQVGALLCDHLLSASLDRTADPTSLLVVTTVVSSRLAAAVARAAGSHHVETLTGFKWLCRPAIEHPEWQQVLAYEEALGYAVGPARDKDGITAALAVADMVAELAAQGRTVLDVLDDLDRRHGAHVTRNGWTTLDRPDAPAVLGALVEHLAERPPETLGGASVTRVDRPAVDVLRLWTDDDTRVALRPSGTEPKLKHYCEAVAAVDGSSAADLVRARSEADRRLDAVLAHLRHLTSA